MTPLRKRAQSAGLLVLGMHRSGTSALSRVLSLCGADIGTRLLGASEGNEAGHWEDAFAVETHERLLQALGRRWSDIDRLDPGWQASALALEARAAVTAYLHDDRARQPLWSVKDPRMSLLAPLWTEAAAELGMPVSVLLLARHPAEVARSLSVRDGLAFGHGLLLWAEYTLAAMQVAVRHPHAVIAYEDLLADWRPCVARVQALPGGKHLAHDAAVVAEVEAYLQPGLRHHHVADQPPLPELVANVWELLSAGAAAGRLEPGKVDELLRRVAPVREALGVFVAAWREAEASLWRRVGVAEAGLARVGQEASDLPGRLASLESALHQTHGSLIEVISSDIRRMQEVTASSQAAAEASEREAVLARALVPQLQSLQDAVARLGEGSEPVPARLDALLARIGLLDQSVAQACAGMVSELGTGLAEARQETTQALAALAESRQEVQATLQSFQSLQASLAELTELRIEAERQLAQARAEAGVLQSRLEDMQDRHAQASGQRDQAESEKQALAKELEGGRASLAAAATAAAGQHARITALTAELDDSQRRFAALKFEVEQLRDVAERFDTVVASRSWRWTRPLRAFARLLRGDWGSSDGAHMRKALREAISHTPGLGNGARSALMGRAQPAADCPVECLPGPESIATVKLAAEGERLPDVFVWSVIDWHFRIQRPQHLARALAGKGHRVFYISNNFVDAAGPGFRVAPLDDEGRLFQVHLNLQGRPPIYFGMPGDEQVDQLRGSLASVLDWTATRASLSLVQHPYWSPLVRALPNARMVYDCMDHHGGFENNASAILAAEARLVEDADLVIVTSGWLEQEIGPKARAVAMVRNACEYETFHTAPAEVFRDEQGRRVIGYYGAIAEWFDLELVREVALAHPDALVLLVGNDTAGAAEALADLPNVRLTGEVPYARLPYYLHGFDACLLPFRVIPLTEATNPVKVYEYLAAGKPVVSVDLPEMRQFGGLVATGADHAGFLAALAQVLSHEDSPAEIEARQAFAAGQTWAHRAESLDAALEAIVEPAVSVVVLTYNNLAFTEACLFSIEAYSDYPNLEVIVVDNASSDGSREWLQGWVREASAAGHRRRLLLNDSNLGFSAGNNVGLRAATGEVLVLLNNDTYVTPGWVRGLCNHLRQDPALGLLGPVTNNIGNEAKIDIAYPDMVAMIDQAGAYCRKHPGVTRRLRTAAFFCVAMRRDVYERVGDMDEAFGVGFFEDDDYCRRIEQAGLHVACAEDVFIHHHLSASFDALKAGRKQELFETNKAVYEAKWGPWVPHEYR